MRTSILILMSLTLIFAKLNFEETHEEKFLEAAPGGDDHDIVAFKIGELRNYLNEKSVEELRHYCLKIENYLKANNKESGMGGVHDYVRTLDKEGCLNYIFFVVLENKELLERTTFDLVVGEENSMMLKAEEPQENQHKLGGLHDYIFRMDRPTLVAWALSAEKYELDLKGTIVLGGLHDRIAHMTNTDIADYILLKSYAYTDLDSAEELNKLSEIYGFAQNSDLPNIEHHKFGGLHDYINNQSRETLVAWALTVEQYSHNGEQTLGGIHDALRTMSDADISNYILNKVEEYPELDDYQKLLELSSQYGYQDSLVSYGGLHDYLFRQSRETLEKWAFTCEKHHRVVLNIGEVLGGLEDYIQNLSNEELAKYILKEAQEHNELNSKDNIERYATQYGISH